MWSRPHVERSAEATAKLSFGCKRASVRDYDDMFLGKIDLTFRQPVHNRGKRGSKRSVRKNFFHYSHNTRIKVTNQVIYAKIDTEILFKEFIR